MKAINDYVVLDQIKEEAKNISGLILTDETDKDNRYKKANVVSVGEQVKIIKKGDTIYYDKHAGHGIDYNNKLYFVIRSRDIVLVE